MGTEVAVNAGVSAAVTAYDTNPLHSALGEPTQSVLESAVIGGLGAGVIHGSLAGLGYSARGALERIPVKRGLDLNLEDAQLRSMFDANQHDPAARAGIEALDERAAFRSANPYGDTETGNRIFTGEIDDVISGFQGRPSTAIARFIPEQSFSLESLDLTTQLVREQKPHVFDNLNTASDTLNEIDNRIADVLARRDGLTSLDAIGEVNGASLPHIQELQAKLDNPNLTPRQKAFAQKNLDQALGEAQKVHPQSL